MEFHGFPVFSTQFFYYFNFKKFYFICFLIGYLQDEKYAIQNYGSTEDAPYNNYSNHIVAQPVQPASQDSYMNEQRNIVEESQNEFNPFKQTSTNPFTQWMVSTETKSRNLKITRCSVRQPFWSRVNW